jgi:hypothetical protein
VTDTDRVRHPRAAALEHDQHQRLPHPRGRLDAVQELAFTIADGMAYVRGASRAAARRRLRAAALLLLQQPQRLLRGDRQVPRGAAHLGKLEMRERFGAENERSWLDALPHPDRRRLAHRAAAAEQPRPASRSRRWRRARRHAVAAHRCIRRGLALPSEEAAMLALRSSRSSPRRAAWRTPSTRWAAPTSSRAVSITLLSHEFGNEVLSREVLLRYVPVFVAMLVWLTRILFIGAFSVAGEDVLGMVRENKDGIQQGTKTQPAALPPRPATAPASSRPPAAVQAKPAAARNAPPIKPAPTYEPLDEPQVGRNGTPSPASGPKTNGTAMPSRPQSRIRQRPPMPGAATRPTPSGLQAQPKNRT